MTFGIQCHSHLLKFGEISNNISETIQDRNINQAINQGSDIYSYNELLRRNHVWPIEWNDCQ